MKKENLPKIVSGFKESIVEVSDDQEGKLIIRGLAVPFNKVSSNGVMYDKGSLVETLEQWKQCPVMYNHQIEGDALPIGKIINMTQKDNGLHYEVEIDKKEEKICDKIKGGFLNKVSIHILPKDVNMKSGYQQAIVGRPLEFSLVPVPGFMETDMEAYLENLNMKQKDGDDKMTKKNNSKTSTIKENKKKVLKEKLSKRLESKKESKDKFKEEVKALKEELNKKFASKTDLKNIISLMEELTDMEQSDSNEEITKDVENHENALKDAAEVLEIVVNRLDRIEEMLEKSLEEEETPEEETPEEETPEEETPEEETPEEETPEDEDEDEDEDEEEKESYKKEKKENVNLSFVDLDSREYSTNLLHLN